MNEPKRNPECGCDIDPPNTPEAVYERLIAVVISVVNEVDRDVNKSGRGHRHGREIERMGRVVDCLVDLLRPNNKANEGHEGEDTKK